MGNTASQLADRFQLLRLAQCLLGAQPLGDVHASDDEAALQHGVAVDLQFTVFDRDAPDNAAVDGRFVSTGGRIAEYSLRSIGFKNGESGQRVPGAGKFRGETQQFEEPAVGSDQRTGGIEGGDSVAHVVEGRLEQSRLLADRALSLLKTPDAVMNHEGGEYQRRQKHRRRHGCHDQIDAIPVIDTGPLGRGERRFLVDQALDRPPNIVHRLLADVGLDDLQGFIESLLLGNLDRLLQLVQFGMDRRLEAVGPGRFAGSRWDIKNGGPIGRQVLLLAGQDVAALPGFGVLDLCQQLFCRLDDLDAMQGQSPIGVGGGGGADDDAGANDQEQGQKDQRSYQGLARTLHSRPAVPLPPPF